MALTALVTVHLERTARHEAATALASDDYSTMLMARTNLGALVVMLRAAADLIEHDHDAVVQRETLLAAEGAR